MGGGRVCQGLFWAGAAMGWVAAKMRMFGFCKLDASGSCGAEGRGAGANRVECQRAGTFEDAARRRTRLSEADRSGSPAGLKEREHLKMLREGEHEVLSARVNESPS